MLLYVLGCHENQHTNIDITQRAKIILILRELHTYVAIFANQRYISLKNRIKHLKIT